MQDPGCFHAVLTVPLNHVGRPTQGIGTWPMPTNQAWSSLLAALAGQATPDLKLIVCRLIDPALMPLNGDGRKAGSSHPVLDAQPESGNEIAVPERGLLSRSSRQG